MVVDPRGPQSRAGQKQRQRRAGGHVIAPAENPVALVDRREQIVLLGDVLGNTKKKEATRPQGIMKNRHDLRLEVRIQVDQQIAAADQIDAGKWRVTDQAVQREDAQLANLLGKLERAGLPGEEALPACR